MQGNNDINIPNYSRGARSSHDAAEIFVREMNLIRNGARNQQCSAHIHFTASKMVENETSGQFYLNNSGYSLPSETIELRISVNLNCLILFVLNYYIISFFTLGKDCRLSGSNTDIHIHCLRF